MTNSGIFSSSHFSEGFSKKVIFSNSHDFSEKLGRIYFEKSPSLHEIEVGYQFYMIKHDISFLPSLVDFLEAFKIQKCSWKRSVGDGFLHKITNFSRDKSAIC